MLKSRGSRLLGVVVASVLVSIAAGGCAGERESLSNPGTDAARVKNKATGSWNQTTRFPAYNTFFMAVNMAADLFKRVEPKYDPLKPLEENKCTPRNRDNVLINPNLSGCVYTEAAAPWVDISGMTKDSDRAAAMKKNYLNYGHQYWSFVRDFTGHDLKGATFRNVNLSGSATFADPQLNGTAMGENAIFAGAKFEGSTFANVQVGGSFVTADFRGFNVKSLGSLANARLDGANFSGTDLTGMTLPYSLIGTDFSRVRGRNLNIKDAVMLSSNFDEADLSGAKLANASIGGETVLAAWPSMFDGLRTQGAMPPSITSMRGANLSFADLSGANLQRVDLSGANLTGANLRGANLKGSIFDGAILKGADLSGAMMACGHMCGTINQVRTSFVNATLDGANFSGATGIDVLFGKASAVGTNFAGAKFSRPDFAATNISGATFENSVVDGGSFRGVTARCTDTGYCTNFAGSKLIASSPAYPAVFEGDFSSANFSKANVAGVKFDGSIAGAIFTCAQVTATYFTASLDVTNARFDGVNVGSALMDARPRPTSTAVNCAEATVLPESYPVPVPTTLVAPSTTVPPTTAPSAPAGRVVLVPIEQACPEGYVKTGERNFWVSRRSVCTKT